VKILLVCFANTCRSPVAEALLSAEVSQDRHVEVVSRGIAGGPGTTPPALERALLDAGVTIKVPSGQVLQRDDARAADLLLFVERRLLREAVVTDPSLWPRSFTLREFARRATINPPSRDEESFAQWLSVVHATRRREELLDDDDTEDVADPGLEGTEDDFATMIGELRADVARVAPFVVSWPASEE